MADKSPEEREAERLAKAMSRKGQSRAAGASASTAGSSTSTTTSSGPKCPICSKTVYQMDGLRANQQLYHKTCFKCTTCSKTQTALTFKIQDGRIYCGSCVPKLVSTPQGLRVETAAFVDDGSGAGPSAAPRPTDEQEKEASIQSLERIAQTLKGETADLTMLHGGGSVRGGKVTPAAGGGASATSNPLARFKCAVCGEMGGGSDGVMVTAGDFKYHVACWKCAGCHTPFVDDNTKSGTYVSREGEPFCSKCNHEGSCGHCGEYIRSTQYMTALERKYHVNCLKCHDCQQVIAVFHTADGKIYCEEHNPNKPVAAAGPSQTVLCAGCQLAIVGPSKKACGKKWHQECLVCTGACKQNLSGKEFYKFNEMPYCAEDYQIASASANA